MSAVVACQRWRNGNHHWRRAEDGGFAPGRYGVSDIEYADAQALVCQHHYAHSMPSATYQFGLFDLEAAVDPVLVGVAVLSVPASKKVLPKVFPSLAANTESLELGRFVILDPVPGNAETHFLAEVFRQAAKLGVRGVVSHSDPLPRQREDGTVVMPGHVGTIYQAKGAHYLERAWPRTLHVLRDLTNLAGARACRPRCEVPAA